jgi:hypothetical protein
MSDNVLRFLKAVCFSFAVLSIATPADGASHEENSGCFRKHLREALAINHERQPMYEQISNYRSTEISSQLIAGERLAIFGSYLFYNFDAAAEEYQARGINIVCDEFVSMSLTPAFRAQTLPLPNLAAFQTLDPRSVQKEFRRALRIGMPEVETVARRLLREISDGEKGFNCMTKHLIESIGRIASLAPGHVEKARLLGLGSPLSISEDMIRSHLTMVKSAVQLDTLAAPVQAEGIAIICQDVPPIHF